MRADNRAALLEGAVKCLLTKGYGATTARDVASAAGVSLAAIGYHFGTTKTLLDEALIQMVGLFGEELEQTVAGEPEDDPRARVVQTWAAVFSLFPRHRQMWLLNLEMVGRSQLSEALRNRLVAAQTAGRAGLIELFLPESRDWSPSEVTATGAVLQSLLLGLMAQMLVDPSSTPSPEDVVVGLENIVGVIRGRRPTAKRARGLERHAERDREPDRDRESDRDRNRDREPDHIRKRVR